MTDKVVNIKQWFKLLRIKQWIKNLLVLFPLFFSGEAISISGIALGASAFLSFSFASSFVYIINDIRDIEDDRQHPKKKNRPLASGSISVRSAYFVAIPMLTISIVSCALLSVRLFYSLLALVTYILINAIYSMGLKNKPIVDVAILAVCFLLRVLYGGFFCGIYVSSWLFLTVLTMSFFLALGKRKGELSKHGASARKALSQYTVEFLDKNMYMFLGLGLTFYSLWTFQRIGSFEASVTMTTVFFILGILFVILISLRYSYDVECVKTDGDPTDTLLSDKMLIILCLLWLLTMVPSIYLGT